MANPNVIDSATVELSLDNSQFERNVKHTIKLLDNLKSAMSFESLKDFSEGAIDSLKEFDRTANGMNLDVLEESARNVNDYFTLWGRTVDNVRASLARMISHELTRIPRMLTGTLRTVYSLTKSGGLSRALKLEQAEFKLKGLGVSWNKALDDINYGVKDTAYGLDSAARAASQLSASGVKLGDDMKAALRGISGVAAMTNSSYDDIAWVYSAVAGMGRVYGQQLNRLSLRGINAYATLAKYLGKSQQEVRKMVSAGQIDFQTFANAMDDAFGEHAKKANETFEGSLANMKASLSRIGAEIATPYYDTAKDIFNALRDLFNNAKKGLDPSLKEIGDIIKILGGQIVDFIKTIKIDEHTFDGIRSVIEIVGRFITSDSFKTFKDTVSESLRTIRNAFTTLKTWIEEFIMLAKPAVEQIFEFIGPIISGIHSTINGLISSVRTFVGRIMPIIEPFIWGIADGIGIISKTVDLTVDGLIIALRKTTDIADPVSNELAPLSGVIYKTVVTIAQVISNLIGHLGGFITAVLPLVPPIVKIVGGLFKIALQRVQRIANYVSGLITAISNNLEPIIAALNGLLDDIGKYVWIVAEGIRSLFAAIWKNVYDPSQKVITNIADGIVLIIEGVRDGLKFFMDALKPIAQKTAYFLGYVLGMIGKIVGATEPADLHLGEIFKKFVAISTVLFLIHSIVNPILGVFVSIKTVAGGLLGLFTPLAALWAPIAFLFKTLIGGVVGIASGKLSVGGIFSTITTFVSSLASAPFTAIAGGFGLITKAISGIATFPFKAILGLLSAVAHHPLIAGLGIGGILSASKLTGIGAEAWNKRSALRNAAGEEILNGTFNPLEYAKDRLGITFDFWKGIKDGIFGTKKDKEEIADQVVETVNDAIEENVEPNKFVEGVKWFWGNFKDAVVNFGVAPVSAAEYDAMDSEEAAMQAFYEAYGQAEDAIDNTTKKVEEATEATEKLNEQVEQVGTGFTYAIDNSFKGKQWISDIVRQWDEEMADVEQRIANGESDLNPTVEVATKLHIDPAEITKFKKELEEGLDYETVPAPYIPQAKESYYDKKNPNKGFEAPYTPPKPPTFFDKIVEKVVEWAPIVFDEVTKQAAKLYDYVTNHFTESLAILGVAILGKKLLGIVGQVFKITKDSRGTFKKLGDASIEFSKTANEAATSAKGIFDEFKTGVTNITGAIKKLVDTFSDTITKITDIVEKVVDAKLIKKQKAENFQKNTTALLMIAGAVGVMTQALIQLKEHAYTWEDFKAIFPVFISVVGSAAILALAFSNFYTAIRRTNLSKVNLVDRIGPIGAFAVEISRILNRVEDVVKAVKNRIKMGEFLSIIKNFAVSFAMVGITIVRMKDVKFEEGINALKLFGVFLGGILVAQILIRKFSGKDFQAFSLGWAGSIVLLAIGVQMFAGIGWKRALTAGLSYLGFIGTLTAAQIFLKKFNVDKYLTFTNDFTTSVPMLAIGVQMFAGIGWKRAVTAMGSYFSFMAILTGVQIAFKHFNITSYVGITNGIATSMPILAIGIQMFNTINWWQAITAVGSYGLFMFNLVKIQFMMNALGIDKFSDFNLKFAVAMPILAVGIKALKDIDFLEAIESLRIFGTFLGIIAVIQKFMKISGVEQFMNFSLKFAIAVPILGVGIRAFKDLDFITEIFPMLEACVPFFLTFGVVMKIINSVEKVGIIQAIQNLLMMTKFVIAAGVLGGMVAVMTLFDENKIEILSRSLAKLIVAFGVMVGSSKFLSGGAGIKVLLMTFLLGEFVGSLSAMSVLLDDYQVDRLDKITQSISKLILVFAGLQALSLLGHILLPTIGTLSIGTVLVVGLIGVAITALYVGLVALAAHFNKDGELVKMFEDGAAAIVAGIDTVNDVIGSLFGVLGGAVGGLSGSFVGEFDSTVLESRLGVITKFLGDANTDIDSFVHTVNTDITETTNTNLTDFANAFVILASAGKNKSALGNVTDAVTSLVTSLPQLAQSLSTLTFEDLTKTQNASSSLSALAVAINAIPSTDAFTGTSMDFDYVDDFAGKLGSLGAGLYAFYTALNPTGEGAPAFDTKFVEAAGGAGLVLNKLATTLPREKGAIDVFIGSTNIDKYVTDLPKLGQGLLGFYNGITNNGTTKAFDSVVVTNAATAGQALSALENSLYGENGVLQFLMGNKDLGLFGLRIGEFGKGFRTFVDSIAGFEKTDAIQNATDVGETLIAMENALPGQGGILSDMLFGTRSIEDFGGRLVSFAQYLQTYQAELDAVDFDKLGLANGFLTELMELFEPGDANITTNWSTLENITDYVTAIVLRFSNEFATEANVKAITTAAEGMVSNFLSGLYTETAKKGISFAAYSTLITFSDELQSEDNIEKAGTGEKTLSAILNGILTALTDEDKLTEFTNLAKKILGTIGTKIKELESSCKRIGEYVIDGIVLGMKSLKSVNKIQKAAESVGTLLLKSLRTATGVHSPSTEGIEIGEFVGQGLSIGLENVQDPVYRSAELLGETVVNGVTDGVKNNLPDDPLAYINGIFGGRADAEELSNLSFISALKTDATKYTEFAELINRLANSSAVDADTVTKLSKLYGSNPKKLAKLVFDRYGKTKNNKANPLSAILNDANITSWRGLYEAFMDPSLATSIGLNTSKMILDTLKEKFGPEFEETSDLATQITTKINAQLGETEGKVDAITEALNQKLLKALQDIELEFSKMHDEVNEEFSTLAQEVAEAQLDFVKMQNDPLATDEDLSIAYRRLSILQGSVESLDRRHEILKKEEEERKKLAKLQNDQEKKAQKNGSSTGDVLGFSASDTDMLTDSLDDLNDSLDDTGDAAENALSSFDDLKDEFARSGYDLASAFEDDGWWKSFLEGSESGLAGYDLGSILSGNTISGLEDSIKEFTDEGWGLGEEFMNGWNDAMFGEDGIDGWSANIQKTIEDAISNINLDFDGWIEEIKKKIGDFFGGIWDKITGWFGGLWDKITGWFGNIKTAFVNFVRDTFGIELSGEGSIFSGLSEGLSSLLPGLEGVGEGLSSAWNSVKEGLGNLIPGLGESENLSTTTIESDGTLVINPTSDGSKSLWQTIGDGISSLFLPNTDQQAQPQEGLSTTTMDDGVYVITPTNVTPVSSITAPDEGLSLIGSNTAVTANSAKQSFGSYANNTNANAAGNVVVQDNRDIVEILDSYGNKLDAIAKNTSGSDVLINGDTLIGATGRGMESELNNRTVLAGRGV